MQGTLPVRASRAPRRRWSRRRFFTVGLVLLAVAAVSVAAFLLLRPPEPVLRKASPEIVARAQSFHNSDTVPDVVGAFAWSPDGERVAAASIDKLQIREVGTGQTSRLTLPLATSGSPMDIGGGMETPGYIMWSPDGSVLALDVANTLIPHQIMLVDSHNATVRHRIRVPIPPELPGKYKGDPEPLQIPGTHMLLGWADEGRSLVSLLGVQPGQYLYVDPSYPGSYPAPNPAAVPTAPPVVPVGPMPNSPALTASSMYVYILDTATGDPVRSVEVYSSTVPPSIYSVALSPDGDMLALAWLDDRARSLMLPTPLNVDVWDLRRAELKYSLKTLRSDPAKSYFGVRDRYLTWSPDGRTIYLATQDTVRVIEASTGKIMYTLPDVVPPSPMPAATATTPPKGFPPPGMPVPVNTGLPLPPIPFPDVFGRFFPQPAQGYPPTPTPNPNQYYSIDGIELSPSGDRLVVFSGNTIRVWDLTSRQLVSLTSIPGLPPYIVVPVPGIAPSDVTWAAHARLLVSFTRNFGGSVWLVDPETGAHLGMMVPFAQEIGLSSDGDKVALLINGRLDIWGTENGPSP